MMEKKPAIRVLVIEDNPGDARLIQEALHDFHADFEVTTALRLEDGLSILNEKTFDTILLDLNLGDSSGIETVSAVFAQVPGIPIIVLTGIYDEALGMQAIGAGAQDYLVKGQFNPALLGRSIQYAGERKKIEKALQESEARYKSLFDSSLDGIYRVDKDGVVSMVNPAGAKMFGFENPDEAIGTPAWNLWADPAERNLFLETLKKEKILKGFPVRARKKNGEIIHLEASCQMLEDEQGEAAGFEGILRDVTERKGLEDQLRQSQKIEAIGTLAGGVAHDFNNILTAIIGYTHLVLMRLKHDDPLHYELQQVLGAADRAALLTQSLLAFSRKQMVRLAPIEVNDVVNKFESFLRRLIREDIEVRTVTSSEKLTIMADKGQIEQALMNLVGNAQDAMPDGGKLIIETKRCVIDEGFVASHGYGLPGVYVCISVTDTGTGMDDRTMEKIFEPFFTTKEVGKGTGLGLALVYGTVKKHDGYITVSSEPGKGATFRIYFPLTDRLTEEPVQPVIEAPLAAAGREIVLIAEDDGALRSLAASILSNAGYQVITAVDGLEAIEKIKKYKDEISIALIDVIMPKKNGREVYKEIASAAPNLKVVFISGYAEDAFFNGEIQGKNISFLMKPLSPEELLRKIRTVLHGQEQSDPA